jgi:hypothetical protein
MIWLPRGGVTFELHGGDNTFTLGGGGTQAPPAKITQQWVQQTDRPADLPGGTTATAAYVAPTLQA